MTISDKSFLLSESDNDPVVIIDYVAEFLEGIEKT